MVSYHCLSVCRVGQELTSKVVNPDRIPGKVIIIGRYGADKVDKHLPGHIEAVKATDHVVVWQCDAMVSTASPRNFPSILSRREIPRQRR